MYLLNVFRKNSLVLNSEMSVLDHLEELRTRIIRGILVVLLFSVVAFVYMPLLFQEVLLAHSQPDFWTYRLLCSLDAALCVDQLHFVLQNKDMAGQFTMHIKSALILGLIMGFPYLVWEIWRYIKPALAANEVNPGSKVMAVVPFLFLIGITFGYYVLAPLSVQFMANYTLDPTILNQFDVSSYISTISVLILACGLIFQLPVLVYFLALSGIITEKMMKKYRKHAIVAIVILAGIITPSPDMLSQLIVGIPIYLLYEISIYTAFRSKHKVTV